MTCKELREELADLPGEWPVVFVHHDDVEIDPQTGVVEIPVNLARDGNRQVELRQLDI